MRSAWPGAFPGGTHASSPSLKAASPTLSPLRTAESARQAHTRAAACRADQAPNPPSIEAERSSTNRRVSSRSGT